MSYFKDPVQMQQITKNVKNVLIDFNIEQYQRELNYWADQYPTQIQVWEDDGGFIMKEFVYE